MTDIPAELRKLWADRDRKPLAARHDDEAVLMTFKDGEDPDEHFEPIEPQMKSEPLLNETTPIRDVKLFPTYKIGPQPVSLATFDVKRKRE